MAGIGVGISPALFRRPFSLSPLYSNLLSAWPLNGNSNDAKGSNNGTDTNVTYGAGLHGQCALFDGTAYIQFANTPQINSVSAFSIVGRIFISSADLSLSPTFYSKATYSTDDHSLCRIITGGEVEWFVWTGVNDGAGNKIITSGAGITVGAWYHVGLVFDGTLTGGTNKAKVYVNGVLQTSAETGTIPNTTTSATTGISLGVLRTAVAQFNILTGKLEDVYLWNRAITQSEMTSLQTKYYPF